MYCARVALLLGNKIGNPEVCSELLAFTFLWQCVGPLLWENPGCGVSVLCRRKLQFSFQARCHARLTLRVPQYPGNIFWRRGNALTLKTHEHYHRKEAAASHISGGGVPQCLQKSRLIWSCAVFQTSHHHMSRRSDFHFKTSTWHIVKSYYLETQTWAHPEFMSFGVISWKEFKTPNVYFGSPMQGTGG